MQAFYSLSNLPAMGADLEQAPAPTPSGSDFKRTSYQNTFAKLPPTSQMCPTAQFHSTCSGRTFVLLCLDIPKVLCLLAMNKLSQGMTRIILDDTGNQNCCS